MRKRILAMVLAGFMIFDTGNVAIASKIADVPVVMQEEEKDSEITQETQKPKEVKDAQKREQKPESTQKKVSQEEQQKTQTESQKPETTQEKSEKTQKPETTQEETQKPKISQEESQKSKISQEESQKPKTDSEEEKLETNQENTEVTQELQESKTSTKEEKIIQEPEISQEEQQPENSLEEVKDGQNLKIPNISQVKAQEWEAGDIYKVFTWSECEFNETIEGTLYEEDEENPDICVLHLDSQKSVGFDFKLALENVDSEEITTKANIKIYKVNKIGEDIFYPKFEIIKKIWSKSITVGLEEISLQQDISLEKGIYLIVFAKTDIAGDFVNYELSIKDMTVYATSISIPKTMSLYEKETATIQVSNIKPADAVPKITWKSDDEYVATVDKNGKVTAESEGNCKISATLYTGKKYTCNIQVKDPYATSISIPEKIYLNKKETATIKVSNIKPAGTTPKITWESDDKSIATVDKNGKVTAINEGECKISATLHTGEEYTCTVYVKGPYATSISIPKKLYLNKKETATIKVSNIKPAGTTPKITWESDDESIATVDKNGKVTANSVGKCKISATLHRDADYYDEEYTCTVYVKSLYATSISIPKKLYLNKKETATIKVSNIKPAGTTPKITWESDDEGIATVNKNGKVTAKRAGKCKISATLHIEDDYYGDDEEYTCTVYVEDPKFKTNKYLLNKGESKSLKVIHIYRPITWKSSNNKIVKVDKKGNITAKKKGKAKIYAKIGRKTIHCSVQVDEPKLSSKSVKLVKGKSTILKVTGTKQKVKWSSSDKKIATVKSGKVTGKKAGKAIITVKVGASKYTCKVTVVETKLKTTSMKIAVNGKRLISTKKKEHNIKWSSNNKKVATVKDGIVTGKKRGTAVITAKIKDVNYTCKVTVENPKLTQTSISVNTEVGFNLRVENTTMHVKWSSSNSEIASVDANGVVVGKSRGEAVITATVGGAKLTCNVTVRGRSPHYRIGITNDIEYDCTVIILTIENRGTEPMRIYSENASLIDKYYTGYNRSLTLISFDDVVNHEVITPIPYVDIQPGQSQYLAYAVNGSSTIYTYTTSIYFDFSYDGENYQASNSRYGGYTYSRK